MRRGDGSLLEPRCVTRKNGSPSVSGRGEGASREIDRGRPDDRSFAGRTALIAAPMTSRVSSLVSILPTSRRPSPPRHERSEEFGLRLRLCASSAHSAFKVFFETLKCTKPPWDADLANLADLRNDSGCPTGFPRIRRLISTDVGGLAFQSRLQRLIRTSIATRGPECD